MPIRLSRRETVFGPGRAVPLDRNAEARAFLDVLGALLWGFHNAQAGSCIPSYESIAARAGCARGTVAEALKALEWAGVLTWQHRIRRIYEEYRDLFGASVLAREQLKGSSEFEPPARRMDCAPLRWKRCAR